MTSRNRTGLAAAVLGLFLHAAAQTAHAQQPAAGASVPPAEGTYDLSSVEVKPAIRNGRQVTQWLTSSFPVDLRGTGTTGSVTLRFRVQTTGRADPASITIVQSTHEVFNAIAVQAVRRMVFSPAAIENRPVPVLVELPLSFADPEIEADSVAPPPPSAP
jgi:TonB family protein